MIKEIREKLNKFSLDIPHGVSYIPSNFWASVRTALNFQNINIVEKKWGFEIHVLNNDMYCFKYLVIYAGHRLGNHYHLKKNETFCVLHGDCELIFDYATSNQQKIRLKDGDTQFVEAGCAHTVFAEKNTIIIEISTHDSPEDSIRLEPFSR